MLGSGYDWSIFGSCYIHVSSPNRLYSSRMMCLESPSYDRVQRISLPCRGSETSFTSFCALRQPGRISFDFSKIPKIIPNAVSHPAQPETQNEHADDAFVAITLCLVHDKKSRS